MGDHVVYYVINEILVNCIRMKICCWQWFVVFVGLLWSSFIFTVSFTSFLALVFHVVFSLSLSLTLSLFYVPFPLNLSSCLYMFSTSHDSLDLSFSGFPIVFFDFIDFFWILVLNWCFTSFSSVCFCIRLVW